MLLEGNGIGEVDCTKVFVEGDVKLWGHVTGGRIVDHGNSTGVHRRVTDVDPHPAASRPGFDRGGVVLGSFV